jgi:hypothetical protein
MFVLDGKGLKLVKGLLLGFLILAWGVLLH